MNTGVVLEFLNMGGGEIMLILAVVMLLFGGKKLPELARGLGKGIRDFKDASEGVKREIHRNINAVDIDEDLKAENEKYDREQEQRIANQNLQEQMYSRPEGSEPINLTKEDPQVVHEAPVVDPGAPVVNASETTAETPSETEKHKI